LLDYIAAFSYWVLVVLWLIIIWLYMVKLRKLKGSGRTVIVLLLILSIDAFRSVIESTYFGLYFNSLYGLLPKGISDVLARPDLLVIPKLFNVASALLILFLLLRYWVPREIREREEWIVALQKAQLAAEKRKEEAEQQSLKFRTIYNSMPDAIVYFDADYRIISTNAGVEKMFGYTTEDLAGKTTSILYESEEEYEHQGRTVFNMCSEEMMGPYELNYRRKNGDIFVGQTLGTVACQGNGSILGYIGVIRDITETKAAESELDKYRHHLEQLVEERTEQLSEARLRAEAANQAKSTFLATMSHEIRTPMNAVIGLTHLMQQDSVRPEQTARLNKIEVSVQHLLSVINNILDISKIEAGKLTLDESDFDLGDFLDEFQPMFQEQLESSNLTFETDLGNAPRRLRGDITRLRQALINYVGNAVKFTQQGSIFLRSARLDENSDGILIRFEVTDTGVGIKPDKLANLFKPFEQADDSATQKHGGTGLGLVITRRLAQLMGGEVGAKSEPGKGSTFWFTARLKPGQEQIATTRLEKPESAAKGLSEHHKGCRILLVEDNAINREVAVAMLSRAGLVVDTAENGQEAVEKVRSNDYDLILMDIQMPVMDGLKATRMIRSMSGKENLPILAMTANVFEESRKACFEAGMKDFVAKPINVMEMFHTLAKWLPEYEPVDSA